LRNGRRIEIRAPEDRTGWLEYIERVDIHETGLELAEAYALSSFVAMSAASAFHAGCDMLLSKDCSTK
jgi:predicted nucleic acid-binding protein